MLPQVPLPGERLPAHSAAVSRRGVLLRGLWAGALLLLVLALVSPQCTPLQEAPPTALADVRWPADVDLLVAPQRSGSGEALAADPTAVGSDSRVESHVCFHVLEGSSADPTGSAGVPVGLQVRQQSFR